MFNTFSNPIYFIILYKYNKIKKIALNIRKENFSVNH